MESSINSQIRINTTQNQILSMNNANSSNLKKQNMEHSYSTTRLPHLSLQYRTLQKTESASKRVRTMKSLRIREQEAILKRISKSFELRSVRNSKKQQRRKSGTEQLSQKQLHIDCQYPKTIVQQQEVISNELQRTKERKRTIFKRMSSILIKHQTTIRNISNQGNEKNSEIQLLILQSQQQGNDEQNVTQSQEVKKHKLRSSVVESEKPKVVLNMSRKSKKAFASIQSYISEKALTQTTAQTINQTNPFISYVCCQSLTEMNGQIQNNLSQNLGRCQLIKPTYPLPEIKLISSARNNCSLLDMNFLKHKKTIINTGNTQRKQRISTNS
ncbi:unnamed protein product (macronuclear) [Paramecium tetraurelia]|uniref:Uncharacterized protein n=1 Tax=Paramecium tetraurelia TaxID=5888 RepID=A0BGF3_PARTE|nr:uncharacterized protein GSPATT00028655001 [Paramecium tetraurelia]CAK57620.1 unnamed protein product [Paramecium tetraurelia]|eukprot:XP_001425018.1 hypothetical protein (macronuclear) [Paramecium tetraurelia strain d4-2]